MKSFDELALAYDNSIDWDSRLKRELPFLQSMSESSTKRVLDMACGSGRHVVALASLGFDVVGFDTSEGMITAARNHAKIAEVEVEFHIADMQSFPSIVDGSFDVVLCLGNSLALLPSLEVLQNVIEIVHDVLRPSGSFFFQVLNFEEILTSGFRFFPIKGGRTSAGEDVVFARFYEHSVEHWSTLVATSFVNKSSSWETAISTQKVLHTNHDVLKKALTESGFENVEFFSDYHKNEFVPSNSRNLIVRARR
ncbi:MAG: class I SAM-dependent methyltransferase [Candidatus Thorarchaeota archaeon]|jgi:2-polyprenyl-3-methyl-5-hydroxy-6-metoxy-1,4-benzoquinol methylase